LGSGLSAQAVQALAMALCEAPSAVSLMDAAKRFALGRIVA
jgi:hypothetical protein